jgi:hypothetical protein
MGVVERECVWRKNSAVSVQGSPRLRQSLAALDSGYGLNEKPATG